MYAHSRRRRRIGSWFVTGLALVACACTTTSGPVAEAPPRPKAGSNSASTDSGLPPTPKTLYALARLLEARQDYDAAALVYETIMNEHKEYLPVYTDFATLLARRGRLDLAEQVLERGIKVEAKDPLLHNNLGVIHVLRSEYEDALRAFERAEKLAPGDPRFRANQALALGLLGRYDEALARYEGVLSPADAQYNIGVIRKMVQARNGSKAAVDQQLSAIMGLDVSRSSTEPGAEPVVPPEPPMAANAAVPEFPVRDESVRVSEHATRESAASPPRDGGSPAAESPVIAASPSVDARPARSQETAAQRDEPVSTAKIGLAAPSQESASVRVDPVSPPTAETPLSSARPESAPPASTPQLAASSVQAESAVSPVRPPARSERVSADGPIIQPVKEAPTAIPASQSPVDPTTQVARRAVHESAQAESQGAPPKLQEEAIATETPARVKTNIVVKRKSTDTPRDGARSDTRAASIPTEQPATESRSLVPEVRTDSTEDPAGTVGVRPPAGLAMARPAPADSTPLQPPAVPAPTGGSAAVPGTAESSPVTVIDAQPIQAADSPEPDAPANQGAQLGEAAAGSPAAKSGYTIQVAAFDAGSPERAQRYKAKIEDRTEYDVMLIVSADRKRIRACIGTYPDTASAYKAKRKLEKIEDFTGCFVRPLNE